MTHPFFIKNLDRILRNINDIEQDSKPTQDDSTVLTKDSKRFDNFLVAMSQFIDRKTFDSLYINPSTNPSWRSSMDWEKSILLLTDKEELEKNDDKRAILWSIPFAWHVLDAIKHTGVINLSCLQKNNPLRIKYKKESWEKCKLKTPFEKFEFLRDYTNENSFSYDSAHIWGLTGATDFLQLYKVVNELVPEKLRLGIINSTFDIIKSDSIDAFVSAYNKLKKNLEDANKGLNDIRITRLYNRLWYVFSFFLNILHPHVFPIYFRDTRATCRKFGIEGYEDIALAFAQFRENKKDIITQYLWEIGINQTWTIKKSAYFNSFAQMYFSKLIERGMRTNLLVNHAIYRCFQDTLWLYNQPGETVWNYIVEVLGYKKEQIKEEVNYNGIRFDMLITDLETNQWLAFVEIKKISETKNWNYEVQLRNFEEQVRRYTESTDLQIWYLFLINENNEIYEFQHYIRQEDGLFKQSKKLDNKKTKKSK